ncbi:methyltransferase [Seohaeicola saemankumensis]|uniref:Methyltransferase n=1 Tax=Seohaeicola saemankumensis TaxID=481181 RepID=A0ABW3TCI8_9RHOB
MTSHDFSSGDLIADRRADYAQALAASGDMPAAIDLMQQALALVPDWAAGWFRLAEWQETTGDTDAARDSWRRVIQIDPQDRFGAGLRLDLARPVPVAETMPAAFVETLFDQYADRFETSLVDQLGYRGPAQIVEGLLRAGRTRFERVLDLGCGTGLMGQAIRPHAGWLEGYDISARMLAQARAKGIYDDLQKHDLSRLDLGGAPFDLILAADVFIYVGALEQIVGWAAASLTPGGVLAFTLEELPDGEGDLRLRPSRRYAHGAEYVTRLLDQAGFTPPQMSRATLRMDAGQPVSGLTVLTARSPQPFRRETDGEEMASA